MQGVGNGIFRIASCDEHLAALQKIVDAGLEAIAESMKPEYPKPKSKATKKKPAKKEPKPPLHESTVYKDKNDGKTTLILEE